MTTEQPIPFSVFVTDWTFFLSLLTFIFCVSTVRLHIDEEKVRGEKSLASLFRMPIPPEQILTAVGKRRAKTAKVAIVVFAATVGIMIVRKLGGAP